jgi:hypothetical protein
MRALGAGALFLLLLLACPRVALADDEPAPESAPPTRTVWYGWQPLIADGSAVLLTAGTSSDKAAAAFGYAVLADYLLASPIIHLAHDRPATAGASFLLRLGLPVAASVVGYSLSSAVTQGKGDDDVPGGVVGAVIGFVVGIGAAMAIDDAVLAREEVPVSREGLTLHPSAIATRGGAELGVAGTF